MNIGGRRMIMNFDPLTIEINRFGEQHYAVQVKLAGRRFEPHCSAASNEWVAELIAHGYAAMYSREMHNDGVSQMWAGLPAPVEQYGR